MYVDRRSESVGPQLSLFRCTYLIQSSYPPPDAYTARSGNAYYFFSHGKIRRYTRDGLAGCRSAATRTLPPCWTRNPFGQRMHIHPTSYISSRLSPSPPMSHAASIPGPSGFPRPSYICSDRYSLTCIIVLLYSVVYLPTRFFRSLIILHTFRTSGLYFLLIPFKAKSYIE